MPKSPAYELPSELAGSELRAGMMTYQRHLDHDGEVKFRRDCYLSERLYDTGACDGMHFKTDRGHQVCYWRGAKVWAKEMSMSENSKQGRKAKRPAVPASNLARTDVSRLLAMARDLPPSQPVDGM